MIAGVARRGALSGPPRQRELELDIDLDLELGVSTEREDDTRQEDAQEEDELAALGGPGRDDLRGHLETLTLTLVLLCFWQALSEFVAAVYARGLLKTDLPPDLIAALLFLSPLLLLLARRGLTPRSQQMIAVALVVGRLIAPLLDPRGRMITAGLACAAGLVWLPCALARPVDEDTPGARARLPIAMMTSVALSVVLHTFGLGLDLSRAGRWQWVGWALGACAVLLLLRPEPAPAPARDEAETPRRRLAALAVGLMSAVLLLYFAFLNPSIMARWTGVSDRLILAALALVHGGFALFVASRPTWLTRPPRATLRAWNGLFVLALVATIAAHQTRFPEAAGAYPLYVEGPGAIGLLPLLGLLLLSPVLYVDLAVYARAIRVARPSAPALGRAFGLAAGYALALVLAHILTTVYDYVPGVGPLLRDRFWLVHLLAGLGLTFPLWRPGALAPARWRPDPRWARAIAGLYALGLLAAFVVVAPAPAPAPQVDAPARVLSLNLQQGYDAEGRFGAEAQRELLASVDADIIGLVETDTARVAGGNYDLVRYLAGGLGLRSYYGPRTVAGTFGVALLSRHPIENPRTLFLPSEGEQTAAISADITIAGRTYHVLVTHLGNGGPKEQLDALLEAARGHQNIIIMGDFNFAPDAPQYAAATGVLVDAWRRRWPADVDDHGVKPSDRIDHVFTSPSLAVEDARYLFTGASDHPAVMMVLRAMTDAS